MFQQPGVTDFEMVSVDGLALKDHGMDPTLKGLCGALRSRFPVLITGPSDPSGFVLCHGPSGPDPVSQNQSDPYAPRPSPYALRPTPFALRPSPLALRPSPYAPAILTQPWRASGCHDVIDA